MTTSTLENIAPTVTAGWINDTGKKQFWVHHSQENKPTEPENLVFDTASLTKSVCTGLLAHMLAQQGVWNLSDLLITWLPEYRGGERKRLTVFDLLAFNAPFALTLSELKHLSAPELWEHILHAPFGKTTTMQPQYVNTTSILLGQAIERATNTPLASLANSLLWQPLQMKHTSFFPEQLLNEFPTIEIVPSEVCPWRRKKIQGEVHDESAWILREKFVAGSAGLFSTVPDLLTLCEALIQTVRGEQTPLALSAETVRTFGQNIFSPPHSGSLGWELNADWMGAAPTGTFGKTGFTGCSLVVNLEAGRAGVLLSNTTYPARPADRSSLTKARQAFGTELFA